jgi:hypothetical protein
MMVSPIYRESIMGDIQVTEFQLNSIVGTILSMTSDIPTQDTDMDWEKIELPDIKPTRFQCGELATLDHWKLVVASKLIKKSVASMIQTAVYTYLQRNWEEHEKRLIVEATRAGITPEEMFTRLITGEIDD